MRVVHVLPLHIQVWYNPPVPGFGERTLSQMTKTRTIRPGGLGIRSSLSVRLSATSLWPLPAEAEPMRLHDASLRNCFALLGQGWVLMQAG